MDIPPFTLAESAVAAHEMHLSYIAAGFTVEQAFTLVQTTLLASIQFKAGGTSDD
jgi:hypothetical protein